MKTTVIASHQVADFSTWKKGFDAGVQMRTQLGIHIKGVYQSTDDQNHVTIISEFPNAETAKAVMANPQLAEEMKNGGVISEVDARVLHEVE